MQVQMTIRYHLTQLEWTNDTSLQIQRDVSNLMIHWQTMQTYNSKIERTCCINQIKIP